MLFIDYSTILFCVILFIIAIVSFFCNPFFRGRGIKYLVRSAGVGDKQAAQTTFPPVSIVIPIQDEVNNFDSKLDCFLNQDYPANYRLILVADEGNTYVKSLSVKYADNKRLYCTFVPLSSRYMSRKKLTTTIGIKAADTDWVILIEPSCRPSSDAWLRDFSTSLTPDARLVQGCVHYVNYAKDSYKFEQISLSYYEISETLHRLPYRSMGPAVALRKSDFMERGGFSGNLHLLYGEYDFLVNKYGEQGKCTLALAEKAWLEMDAPYPKAWYNEHIFYWETRKYLQNGRRLCTLYNWDNLMLYFNYLLIALFMVFGILTEQWWICAAAGASLLFTIISRIYMARKAFRTFNVSISLWKIIPFELASCRKQLFSFIRFCRADKYDFTSHKL